MTISRIAPVSEVAGPARHGRTASQQTTSGAATTTRAVVPLDSPRAAFASPQMRSIRPDASFVAQLIATAAQAPQTRVLRRASPVDATAAYASTGARKLTEHGKVLFQTV